MCLGIPGEVVEIVDSDRDLATVDVAGVRRNINISLLEDDGVAPGDWVLIHVGFAMAKIDEIEAKEALEILQQMGQAYADEVQAVIESRSLSRPRWRRVRCDRAQVRAVGDSSKRGRGYAVRR